MKVLTDLEPREVFSYFEQLSDIPRGSQHEKQVSDWIKAFAQARGLFCRQDAMGDLIIKKPGSKGREREQALILHGHMDMVCKKEVGVEHDFLTQGVDLVIENGWIHGRGTTLGADNGIGVAYILALLDSSDIPHPPLEVVLTVMEEMGKAGGSAVDVSAFTGKRMLDLNWHKDEYLLAGCAGDISVKYRVPIARMCVSAQAVPMKLDIRGLKGGHCEFDIVLERANAIILLARFLRECLARTNAQVGGMRGGVQNNVIPSEAEALLFVPREEIDRVRAVVAEVLAQVKNEYRLSDPDIQVTLCETDTAVDTAFSRLTSVSVTYALMLIPNGVMSMSLDIPGISECSNNIGLLTMDEKEIVAVATITSGVSSRKYEVLKRVMMLAELSGNGVCAEAFGTDAPEWRYNADSPLLRVAREAYGRLFDAPAGVEVMPASLELGLFRQKIPGLDILSIGTKTTGVHTPAESLEIASVGKVWRLFKEVLKTI